LRYTLRALALVRFHSKHSVPRFALNHGITLDTRRDDSQRSLVRWCGPRACRPGSATNLAMMHRSVDAAALISTIVRFLTSSMPHESNTVTTTVLHPRRRWSHLRGAKLTPRLDSSHCFAPSEFLDSSRMTRAADVDDSRGCSRCLAAWLGSVRRATLRDSDSSRVSGAADQRGFSLPPTSPSFLRTTLVPHLPHVPL
jgi:hypothetical protein